VSRYDGGWQPESRITRLSSSERDFTTGPKHKRALLAVNLATRKLLWEKRDEQTATVLPMSTAAQTARVSIARITPITCPTLTPPQPVY